MGTPAAPEHHPPERAAGTTDLAPLVVQLLFRALVQANANAAILHGGDKPLLLTSDGQVEISHLALSKSAVESIGARLLSGYARRLLDDCGLAQEQSSVPTDIPGETFTITAARFWNDLWLEIRRGDSQDDRMLEFFKRLAAADADREVDDLTSFPSENLSAAKS